MNMGYMKLNKRIKPMEVTNTVEVKLTAEEIEKAIIEYVKRNHKSANYSVHLILSMTPIIQVLGLAQ